MTTPIFALADEYIRTRAEVDPAFGHMVGIEGDYGVATDYSPDGIAARHEHQVSFLRRLEAMEPTGSDDELAKLHMRERLEASTQLHETGDWKRILRVPYGLIQNMCTYVDLAPRKSEDDWAHLLERIKAIPGTVSGMRATLEVGRADGTTVARLQVLKGAEQARLNANKRVFDQHAEAYGDGPLRPELERAAQEAYAAFEELANYLQREYAPDAREADGVGADLYKAHARQMLGADLDPQEAYEWGWAELYRIEEEMATEASKILPGKSLDEVIAHLDSTNLIDTPEEYLAWLTAEHQWALDELNGVHFDIDERLMSVDVQLVHGSSAGSPYYTGPSEDLSRKGRTWWPVGPREKFAKWGEYTTVYHEGVPGHHLQIGQTKVVGDKLSRFAKSSGSLSGYGEGWALYAERLADELGWFERAEGARLGQLKASAMRAARVVIDIGTHLDLPLPAQEAKRHGAKWNFDVALDVLQQRGRIAGHRAEAEIVRYFGWPSQAICYKMGERAWLAAREDAKSRDGASFNLKDWHTKALNLGPIGLDNLRRILKERA
ncbi:DUF885 domain-containing protein [Natronoglycomyces albus]|uniref:DUF885 domain-containing protein n=1 Tax=Natronoglycomyces albus TaxID=2811108 RepID=A0A895XPD6_9ACTN|nr:DUF885 domain-containing protein [Natronoglycomyces albus]QSB04945.1 DUF885 domain-containing protein [Natronoglycomyces albus]